MKTLIDKFEYINYTELNPIEKPLYDIQISSFLSILSLEYPHFKKWYKSLFDENQNLKNDRQIIICLFKFRIAGLSILKKNNNENKICTFRVDKKFRNLGIGRQLMELSLNWLEDEKPLITLHQNKQNQFNKLFEHYNFKLEQRNKNYYHIFNTELAYNGILPKKDKLLIRIPNYIFNEALERMQSENIFDTRYLYEFILDKLDITCPKYNSIDYIVY